MLKGRHLREVAEKCRRRAEMLSIDAETLRRFGEDLAELARRVEKMNGKALPRPARRG